jgi:hypothetical protein
MPQRAKRWSVTRVQADQWKEAFDETKGKPYFFNKVHCGRAGRNASHAIVSVAYIYIVVRRDVL